MEGRIKREDAEKIRARILFLIESEFESDAAFERALSLADKTVSNWRRGRSSSYMRMLPSLSALFGVNISELLDMPLMKNTSELSDDELKLLNAYRSTASLPPKMRAALFETLEGVIRLYTASATEAKGEKRSGKKKEIANSVRSGEDKK